MPSFTSPRRRSPSPPSHQQASSAFERSHRERRLYEASVGRCVESLAQLLQEDRLILARAPVTCFDETPLHVAYMQGHVHFAKVLLAHKRDLAMELDSQVCRSENHGRTPLHWASANEYVKITRELLQSDPLACFVHDEDGWTPLHLAMMKEHRLSHGQTALHLGVSHNRLEALKVLVETVRDGDLVKAQDDVGNTILHLAAAKKQIEFLLTIPGLEVNTPNSSGLTALDILEQGPGDSRVLEIETSLQSSGASLSRDIQSVPYRYDPVLDPPPRMTSYNTTSRSPKNSPSLSTKKAPSKKRSTLRKPLSKKLSALRRPLVEADWLNQERFTMVVALLLVTVAFQAATTPPGGVWQDDYKVDANGNPVKEPHVAGTSIMAHIQRIAYGQFMIFNPLAFLSSLSIILLLLSGLQIKRRRWMWTQMAITYFIALRNILLADTRGMLKDVTDVLVVCWLCLMGVVFMGNVVRL
ncbi:hypothetical protein ACJRO7_016016 [Eucalyptus globulus]|uniref:PGG domain-containing protein n=1 Tax=Eucalyptus globulus TaxID=34317 RepID=A0ABD3L5P5_EUCGL